MSFKIVTYHYHVAFTFMYHSPDFLTAGVGKKAFPLKLFNNGHKILQLRSWRMQMGIVCVGARSVYWLTLFLFLLFIFLLFWYCLVKWLLSVKCPLRVGCGWEAHGVFQARTCQLLPCRAWESTPCIVGFQIKGLMAQLSPEQRAAAYKFCPAQPCFVIW